MKVILVFDTETNDAKVISKTNFTQKDLIDYLLDYFKISEEDVKSNSQKREIVMCRQFIIYWSIDLFDIKPKKLREMLNYSEESAIITTTLYKIKDMFDTNDQTYIRPYNNHVKYFAGFGIIKEIR